MNNLWKIESTQSRPMYVDLFASVQNESDFREVDELTECFKSYQSIKNNQKATELRTQGNDEFRLKNWSKAMQWYNQSLCFAEVGTEEVAMAYANRSACFFHLQKYDKVLADIELAKSVNLPDRLVQKLEQRKQESLKMMEAKVEPPTKHIPQLSYPANRNYPCLAEVVDIKRNNKFGLHLVAIQDIPVGKVVLFEEDLVAMRTDKGLACETCFRLNANFIACPKCANVVFCSIECMNRNLTHNWECGAVPKSTQHDDFIVMVKFQIRMVFLALQIFGSVERLMEFVDAALKENRETLPTSLHDLQSQYHFLFKLKKYMPRSELFVEFYRVYKGVHSLPKINALFDTEERQRFLMHLVTSHSLVTHINSSANEKRKSLANVVSILNHSCDPNLRILVFGRYLCFITIKPIKKGDQLFICYLQDSMESLKKCQEKLKIKWNFICKCSRCNPMTYDREDAAIKSDPRFTFILMNYGNDEKSLIVMEYCMQLLNKYGNDPWSPEFADVAKIYTTMLAFQMR